MQDSLKLGSTVLSWVNSVAVCRNSDLAASGAGNGSVRLWGIEDESKGIRPLFELSMVSYSECIVKPLSYRLSNIMFFLLRHQCIALFLV